MDSSKLVHPSQHSPKEASIQLVAQNGALAATLGLSIYLHALQIHTQATIHQSLGTFCLNHPQMHVLLRFFYYRSGQAHLLSSTLSMASQMVSPPPILPFSNLFPSVT